MLDPNMYANIYLWGLLILGFLIPIGTAVVFPFVKDNTWGDGDGRLLFIMTMSMVWLGGVWFWPMLIPAGVVYLLVKRWIKNQTAVKETKVDMNKERL